VPTLAVGGVSRRAAGLVYRRYRSCLDGPPMIQLHSRPKEQREAIRNLVHLVLTRDMGTFNPDRFKDWIKDTDARFRKVGLTLLFEIRSRTVHFTIKEIRTSRVAFKFTASTRVPFDDRDVVMSVEDFSKTVR
jgi:hypothetical protein